MTQDCDRRAEAAAQDIGSSTDAEDSMQRAVHVACSGSRIEEADGVQRHSKECGFVNMIGRSRPYHSCS